MKAGPAPEIVEILDDGDTFSDQPADPPRSLPVVSSRWSGPAVAVGLLAVAAYVVVSSSIGSNPSEPPRPGLISPQYYVAEAPPGFSMYMAQARGEAGTDLADFTPSGEAELWATADATATTGSWFVISRGRQHATGRNSNRAIVDGIEVVFEHDPPSGQTRVSFVKDGHEMAITSFGWHDRQLVRLVRSVNVDDSIIRFSNGFFTSDHQRIMQRDPAAAMFGLQAARVGYATGLPADLAEGFTITIAGEDRPDERLVTAFALTNTTSFTVGNLPAIVGQWAAEPSISVAQWHDGDRLITLHGNLATSRLEAIAQTVHETTTTQVRDQLAAAPLPVVPALRTHATTVVSGMLSDGWGWNIQVSQRNPDDPADGYLWWIGQPGDSTKPSETRPSGPANDPRIDTFVEHGRTYVLASIPRSMEGAELRVAPTGLPSIVTRLRDVDPALPAEFAASVFMEPVTFTARIVDAAGTTVATWPTFGRVES